VRGVMLPRPRAWGSSKKMPILLWADAICINQEDVQERNRQVQLMGSIYHKASMGYLWLGPNDGSIGLAIKSFNLISRELKNLGPRRDQTMWMRQFPELFQLDSTERVLNQAWDSVKNFLELPHWSRIWILQEMVLAKRLCMISGDAAIDFDSLLSVLKWAAAITSGELPRPEFFPPILWSVLAAPGYFYWGPLLIVANYRLEVHNLGQLSPARNLGAIYATATYRATDPRDKIYGFLGLVKTDIVPDYSKSVTAVYQEFAGKLIKETGDINFLNYSGIAVDSENEFGLPSWTPNWYKIASDYSEGRRILPPLHFQADTGMTALNSQLTSISERCLHTSGICCETIGAVEPEVSHHTLFRFCCDYVSRNNGVAYANGIPRLQAIFRTIMVDQDPRTYERLTMRSNSEWTHELALAFLRLLLRGIDEENTGESLQLLGLAWGANFSSSYSQRFFATSSTTQFSLRNLENDAHECAVETTVLCQILRALKNRLFHTINGYLGQRSDSAPPGSATTFGGATIWWRYRISAWWRHHAPPRGYLSNWSNVGCERSCRLSVE